MFYLSSNVNEIIRAVSNFFFHDKISQVQKSTKLHQDNLVF